jgi:hypothetical protein
VKIGKTPVVGQKERDLGQQRTIIAVQRKDAERAFPCKADVAIGR